MARTHTHAASGEAALLWTPEELELFLRVTATPSHSDAVLKHESATTSSSPSLLSDDFSPEQDSLATDVIKAFSATEMQDAELDPVARRLRRTEIERLSRRRRQATLRAMRDEVKVLEAQFAGLMANHATRKQEFTSDLVLHDGIDEEVWSSDVKFSEQVRRLRERFIDLKLREGELESEHKDLQRALRGKQLLSMSIQSMTLSSARTWLDPEDPVLPASEVEFQFRPADEYVRLMRGAYEELQTLEAKTSFESLGSNCMGWSDRRAIGDEHIVFSLTKTFVGREPQPILHESWDVFSNESRLRQSFGSWGVHMQLRIIDRPSDDIVVLHRSNVRRGCKGQHRHHVVFLLFRVRTADGFTLCMRSMPSLQTPLTPPDHWTGIFTWIHLRETRDSDGTRSCHVEYSNYMPYKRRRPLGNLFVAFLSTVVRWESACIASRLLTFT